MRAAFRLLATASKDSFVTPGAPTGLTGLLTHSAPRSTLLYLYSTTLERLKTFPKSSVYRQSTEALTKHRMSIIERVRPQGLQDWQQRVQKTIDEHPEAFRKIPVGNSGEYNVVWKASAQQGMASPDWEDEEVGPPQLEGIRSEEEREGTMRAMNRDPVEEHRVVPRIEPEPALTLGQIEEIEQEMSAGLLEEIIQVAEGERELVDKMAEEKVWEDLVESPAEGQWAYFERDTHTPSTQAP